MQIKIDSKYYNSLSIFLSLITLIIVVHSIKDYNRYNPNVIAEGPPSSMKLEKSIGEAFYLENVLNEIQKASGKKLDIKKIQAYSLSKKSTPNIKSSNLFTPNRESLIIRYTEIGCNACADSVFEIIKEYKSLVKKYDIKVWVDFTDYEYYLKWLKLSDVYVPIVGVKKGTVNIPVENSNNSYIFTISPNYMVSSLFIPDAKYANELRKYFANIK